MSISYSGIVNYGKVTLPSVEGGLGSMNILRDPPKSIMTRRKDKVGETSSITSLIDDSGDRACEGISTYARGINPFVSVDYGNAGNNGGQRVGGISTSSGSSGNTLHGGQAYLPYRVARDGAFRPPVKAPFDLLPLSRMPRTNTSGFTKPGFVDYSKKLMCPGGNYRAVKDDTIKSSIRPTATFRIDAPLVEPFEVKYVIKNPTKFDKSAGVSGLRTQDITNQVVQQPSKEINKTILNSEDMYTNQGSTGRVRYVDNSHIDTTRYLQDTLNSSVDTNKSQSIQITPIEDIFDIDIKTKDSMNISYTPLKTGPTKENHMHKDIELQRRVLNSTMATNKHRNVYSRPEIEHQSVQKRNRPIAQVISDHGTIKRQSDVDLNSREYSLKPTIKAGGMTGRGNMPLQNRTNDLILTDSNQASMNRKVMEMQIGRNR
jgi:hypothetical protein